LGENTPAPQRSDRADAQLIAFGDADRVAELEAPSDLICCDRTLPGKFNDKIEACRISGVDFINSETMSSSDFNLLRPSGLDPSGVVSELCFGAALWPRLEMIGEASSCRFLLFSGGSGGLVDDGTKQAARGCCMEVFPPIADCKGPGSDNTKLDSVPLSSSPRKKA